MIHFKQELMQRVSVASYNHKELPGWPFTTAKKGNKIVSKMREEHVSLFFFLILITHKKINYPWHSLSALAVRSTLAKDKLNTLWSFKH